MHHAETKTHKYTDLNFDFEIFWLKERRIQKVVRDVFFLVGVQDNDY